MESRIEREILVNPAAYAIHEIEAALDRIEVDIENIKEGYFIGCKSEIPCHCSVPDECCCHMMICCCGILLKIINLPCNIASCVLSLTCWAVTCGNLQARLQAKIDEIQLDKDEAYTIETLKASLNDMINQDSPTANNSNTFFGLRNPASSQYQRDRTLQLIESALEDKAISKLRHFLETLKRNIAIEHNPTSGENNKAIAIEPLEMPTTSLMLSTTYV